ncbi:hypothetical protein EVAR_83048_1 [Eumeta japonica]|uniref:Uncharacterized protein n=1 Tax=Eumeta variegata TaxID=151549 RepID=A0A4C1VMN2_EUMVA|nr:hypothetical protein EVAR_83048_1 [Eumeta japonica]
MKASEQINDGVSTPAAETKKLCKEYVVTAVHRHSQPQRSHQCVADLVDKNWISVEGRDSGADGKEEWGDRGESETPKLSFIGRNTIAIAVTSHLYSLRLWHLTGRVDSFSCY